MKREEALKIAKPIIFNTYMVKGILDGRKTVTRRVVKNSPCECTSKQVNGVCKICDDKGGFYLPDDYVNARSPYKVGDYLYVRETWGRYSVCEGIMPIIYYKADGNAPDKIKWIPSIHMPKLAARIFLRVTNVRVERLRDISVKHINKDFLVEPGALKLMGAEKANATMARVWDRTIKKPDLDKYGWAANPWVWVIEFERLGVADKV